MQIGLIKSLKEVLLIQSWVGNVESNFYYKPKVGFDVIINKRERERERQRDRERVNVIGWCVHMLEVLLFEIFFLDKGFIIR